MLNEGVFHEKEHNNLLLKYEEEKKNMTLEMENLKQKNNEATLEKINELRREKEAVILRLQREKSESIHVSVCIYIICLIYYTNSILSYIYCIFIYKRRSGGGEFSSKIGNSQIRRKSKGL